MGKDGNKDFLRSGPIYDNRNKSGTQKAGAGTSCFRKQPAFRKRSFIRPYFAAVLSVFALTEVISSYGAGASGTDFVPDAVENKSGIIGDSRDNENSDRKMAPAILPEILVPAGFSEEKVLGKTGKSAKREERKHGWELSVSDMLPEREGLQIIIPGSRAESGRRQDEETSWNMESGCTKGTEASHAEETEPEETEETEAEQMTEMTEPDDNGKELWLEEAGDENMEKESSFLMGEGSETELWLEELTE